MKYKYRKPQKLSFAGMQIKQGDIVDFDPGLVGLPLDWFEQAPGEIITEHVKFKETGENESKPIAKKTKRGDY